MVLEAGYPSTTGFRKVVKATILVRKKAGMSDADFIEHYNHKHAQMAAPVLQKHNVITYSLVGFIDSQYNRCKPKAKLSCLPAIADILPPTRSNNHGRHAAWAGEYGQLRCHLHLCVQGLQGFCKVHVELICCWDSLAEGLSKLTMWCSGTIQRPRH
jgi:hypothetical protein